MHSHQFILVVQVANKRAQYKKKTSCLAHGLNVIKNLLVASKNSLKGGLAPLSS